MWTELLAEAMYNIVLLADYGSSIATTAESQERFGSSPVEMRFTQAIITHLNTDPYLWFDAKLWITSEDANDNSLKRALKRSLVSPTVWDTGCSV
jgi:hypothetical protein